MKKTLLLILTISLSATLHSQKSKTFYYSPQHISVNAIRLDLEFTDSTRKKSILFSPYFQLGKTNRTGGAAYYEDNYYYSSNYNNFTEEKNDDLVGVGIYLAQKIYLTDGKEGVSKHHPYFLYGASYLFSKIEYAYHGTPSYYDQQTGNYIEGEVRHGTDKFNIFGAQTTMGDRIDLGEVFSIDIYAGIGLKYTDLSPTSKGARNYSRSVFDYGYTGIHPVVGARLGFKI